jgi:TolA-binding protein
MKQPECTLALVQQARRSALSRAESLRLKHHLAACPTCRFDQSVFALFDPEDLVLPGDDALDAQLVNRVMRSRTRSLPWWRGRRPAVTLLAACVGLLLVASLAGAWQRMHRGGAPAEVPSGTPAPAATALAGRAGTSDAPTPPPSTQSADAPAPVQDVVPFSQSESAAAGTGETSKRARAALGPEVESASALFEAANRERRAQNHPEAVKLYEKLVKLYPGANEAQIARVSLGRLLLDEGAASAALGQFTDYLRLDRGGALAPEALFGHARALELLGRASDARPVWTRIATEFKDTVYAIEARKRLSSSD